MRKKSWDASAAPSHSTNDVDICEYCYYNIKCAREYKKTRSKNVFKTVPLIINATPVILSTHEAFATCKKNNSKRRRLSTNIYLRSRLARENQNDLGNFYDRHCVAASLKYFFCIGVNILNTTRDAFDFSKSKIFITIYVLFVYINHTIVEMSAAIWSSTRAVVLYPDIICIHNILSVQSFRYVIWNILTKFGLF